MLVGFLNTLLVIVQYFKFFLACSPFMYGQGDVLIQSLIQNWYHLEILADIGSIFIICVSSLTFTIMQCIILSSRTILSFCSRWIWASGSSMMAVAVLSGILQGSVIQLVYGSWPVESLEYSPCLISESSIERSWHRRVELRDLEIPLTLPNLWESYFVCRCWGICDCW